MFFGEYKHTLDEKKRLLLPSKLRKHLGKKIVITHGLDNCLFVYPAIEWREVANRLAGLSMGKKDSRRFNRFMLAGAIEEELDSAGRIVIPEFLREYARINTMVVVAGVHNRLEIWDEKKWGTYKNTSAKNVDKLAEKLGEVGAL